jgi:predicted O-methyltransferase YrrM
VIHIDIDEFIALKKHTNIKKFISEYITGDTAGIGINWRHFGDSGNTVPSYEPVTQRFISCELNGNKTIKTLFDKSKFSGWRMCHCVQPINKFVIKSTNGSIIDGPHTENVDYSVIQLNHYKCKTLPEFKFARSRGRCDISNTYVNTDNDNFNLFNFNEIKDLTAYIFYNDIFCINDFIKSKNIEVVEGSCDQIKNQIDDLVMLTKKAKNILEIGFNAGHSSEIFLKNNLNVTSFDLGEHNYVTIIKEYIDFKFPNKHRLILGDSTITIPNYNCEETFDLIFIDGGHDYQTVKSDIENSRRFATKETIIIIDDINYTNPKFWTIGPTTVWKEYIDSFKIIELTHKEYFPGRGMSWGKFI